MRSQFEVAELEMTRQLKGFRILPEMVKAGCCTEEFLTLLLDLVHTAWEEHGG